MLRYFSIGGYPSIPSYNLFVGIGMALGMLYLQYVKKFACQNDQRKSDIHLGIFISMVFGFIGAFAFDAYTQDIPLRLHNLNQIGLTLLGGFFTGLVTFVTFLKVKSIPILNTLNLVTPSFCISHIFGRIGCFFAGCCYGSKTDFILGVQFPEGSIAHYHFKDIVHVHPTQLYESFFVFLLFLVTRKSTIKNKFILYILSYSIFRFCIEFIRADDRGVLFNQSLITPSQFISLMALVTALVALYIKKCKTISIYR